MPDEIFRPVDLPPVTSPDDWRSWPVDAKEAYLKRLEWEVRVKTPLPYFTEARPKQLPPDHPRHHLADKRGYSCGCAGNDLDWFVWMLMAGRGLGKTYVGSNWVLSEAMKYPDSEWAVLAPTHRDVMKTCFHHAIIPTLSKSKIPFNYRRNELQLTLPNGAIVYGYSADNPERIRGANLWGAWCDELGSWRYSDTWYAGLIPALRKGPHPRVVVTTTPRPTDLMLDLVNNNEDGSLHLTRGSMWENEDNLSPRIITNMKKRYEGTRLGLQELEGQLLEDVEGALFTRAAIEGSRIKGKRLVLGHWVDDLESIQLVRVVVGFDPAVTSNEGSDHTGIVVVGIDDDGHGYVLADLTMKGTPTACIEAAIKAYHAWHADCIVAEVNNGGDYVGELLRTVNSDVPLRVVRATRGKVLRAEPVSSLYVQGKIHHYGVLGELEDQMCTWTPLSKKSPDRLDALVWGFTELKNLDSRDYHSAYGTRICEHCGRGYLVEHDACPHCHRRPTL